LAVYTGADLVEDFVDTGAVGSLLHTGSVTKFVVGTAVAVATRRGLLPELDESLSAVLTEWRATDKATITLRHLMTHTSGLRVQWPPSDEREDAVAFALGREVVAPPGAQWAYDNHGASLVAEVVQRATGQKIDAWIAENLFQPLGISRFAWNRDSAGNPYAMSALQLTAVDLARVGRLWLQHGAWNATQLFDESWPSTATAPFDARLSGVGLLLFVVPGSAGPVLYGHDGSGGQHLWLLPQSQTVVARLRDMWATGDDPVSDLRQVLAEGASSCSGCR
jgi:CubicO group peptidase (beta-lactamase class C family)